jgi:hypothetical protein
MSAIAGRPAPAWRALPSSLLCALLLAGAPGCVSKQAIRPDAFDVAGNGDIKVFLRERRMIEFEGGSYGSVDSAGTRYLVGNGIDHRPDSAVVRVPFSGHIPFSAIDRIEKHHTEILSALYVTLFIGIFAVIGFRTNITD